MPRNSRQLPLEEFVMVRIHVGQPTSEITIPTLAATAKIGHAIGLLQFVALFVIAHFSLAYLHTSVTNTHEYVVKN